MTDVLGIRYPVLLAPMGDVAGGRLAAAVSAGGGLGLIGGGYAHLDWLERELAAAGDARIGVGFITFALDERPEALDRALDSSPVAIQLSFGDPRPYIDRIKDTGALAICQVQDVDEACRCAEAGADLVVAQGLDAGGHGRPVRGTMGLVPAVVDAIAPTPVIAAGGIADGRGVAAALMLGASGAALGTRLAATHEALYPLRARELLVNSTAGDTTRTSAFDVVRGPAWPSGHDARALRNELILDWDAADTADPEVVEDMRRRYRSSATEDYSMRPVWAGEGVDLVDALEHAEDVVRRIGTSALALTTGRPTPTQG